MRQRTKKSLAFGGAVVCLTSLLGSGKMSGDNSEYRSSIPKPLWRQKVELYDKRSSLINEFGTPQIHRFTANSERYNSLAQEYQTTDRKISDVEQNIETLVGEHPRKGLFQAIAFPISMFGFLVGGFTYAMSILSLCTKEENVESTDIYRKGLRIVQARKENDKE